MSEQRFTIEQFLTTALSSNFAEEEIDDQSGMGFTRGRFHDPGVLLEETLLPKFAPRIRLIFVFMLHP